MEMQDISEGKEKTTEGTAEPMQQVQTEEEAENAEYEQLKSPPEDVYVEAYGRTSDKTKAEKPGEGNGRLYRTACLFLGLLCLALLLLVVVLSVKLHTGSTACSEQGQTAPTGKTRTPFGPVCSYDQCQAYFNRGGLQQCECYCAPGWKGYGRSCFFFSTFRLSWEESLQNCTSRGGSLAIVSSPEVQNFLARAGSLTYWIGLRELNSAWTWVNRTVLRESHWAEAPLAGDCVALMGKNPPDKNWIKASCQSTTYFICQQNF